MSDTEKLSGDESAEQRAVEELASTSEREAYFDALRLWIQQAQMYQNLSVCFPYYMMSLQGGAQTNTSVTPLLNNNYQPAANNPPEARPADRAPTPSDVISRNGGYEYLVPPLYKRLLAEILDFIFLFVVKLFLALLAGDYIQLEKFDLDKLTENLDSYEKALEMTSELLVVELTYRVMVCFYEALCLSYSGANGATPGKAMLGLKVVSASAVIPAGSPRAVLIHPAAPLSFSTALSRSLIKNLLISLLFPLCFALFVFRYNRTGYDLICNTIVVEDTMFPQRRNAP